MTRSRRTVFVVAVAALALFAGWLSLSGDGSTAHMVVENVGTVGFCAFAAGCALDAGRRGSGPQRAAWFFVAAGLAGRLAGDLVWAYFDATGQPQPPVPSLVDVLYLLLPVMACLSALVAVPGRHDRSGLLLVLDGAIAATSLFVVAWSLGLHELYQTSRLTGVAFAVAVAYPVSELAMVLMVVVVVAKSPAGRRLSPGLLAAGLLFVAVTDAALVYLNVHPPYDDDAIVVGWAAGMTLAGAAGLASKRSAVVLDARRGPSGLALWLPYLPVPFAVVLGVAELWPVANAAPVLVAGVVLILAALVRQFSLLAQNRRLLATVSDIALRDPLTGLANRALFSDRLSHAIALRQRAAHPVAVVFLDLDDFKLVNDSLGHPAGDGLLRSVGARLADTVRPGDTVARLGGDEFAVLVEDTAEAAHDVAERIVRAFDEPFVVDGREVAIRPSVGLVIANDLEPEVSADDLFRRADLAMYSAKRAQTSGVRTFTSDMRVDATEHVLPSRPARSGHRRGVARIQLVGDLRRAIDERQLTLVYQPKISLASGAAVGVEALVRWPHPELGILEPADFLPLVRQNGLLPALTDLVTSRAIEECAQWHAAGVDIPVAINLSAPSLNDDVLGDRIMAELAEHGLPPDALSVEITEDLLLASVIRTRAVLDRLRENGIRIAIDDFGSGYAAMTYLRELPIDEIKLDRQFVAPILHDARAAAIVRSVIELADTFGISSVAEGVEDRATAERLAEYGCGFVQGHYFSPPVPARAIRVGGCGTRTTDFRVRSAAAARPSSA